MARRTFATSDLRLLSRRSFLAGSMLGAARIAALGSLAAACGAAEANPEPAGGDGSCLPTADNIQGPYYRDGAPWRNALAEGMEGTPLVIEGTVFGADCGSPLAEATLDIWQANDEGHYDNDGFEDPDPSQYVLRGRLQTSGDGAFRIETIVPGRYLNGPRYRPAHVHVKLSAPGYRELTTQLYFPDDPYNEDDPWIRESLVMDVQDTETGKSGRFDFVLAAS